MANKAIEKEVKTNDVVEPQEDKVKGAIQTLIVQLTEHQKKADYHSTMAIKAQGALEVLRQLHPEENEEN